MPLTRSQIARNEASVPVAAYGETLNIIYLPSKMTDEFIIKFTGIEEKVQSRDNDSAKEALKELNEILADIIKSWDFYEDEDQAVMVPIEPETFAGLELSFRLTCIYAIIGHVRPEAAGASVPPN